MITMPIELYTDGSCQNNPGAGGYGYIIRYWDTPEGSDMPEGREIEFSQGYRLTTNNRMEIMAAITGIKDIIAHYDNDPAWGNISQLNLFSDSEYLCKAINQRWIQKWADNNWMTSGFQGSKPKPVKNKDLWETVIEIQNALNSRNITLTITHVRGHNGNEYNERCDKLATSATAGTNHIIDTVYEQTTTVCNKR